MSHPEGLVVDTVNNELVVANELSSIMVCARPVNRPHRVDEQARHPDTTGRYQGP